MPAAPYRIYALQYADRQTNSSEVFLGDQQQTPMSMAYFIWAVTNGEQTVVVDLGFTEAVGTRRGRRFLRAPAEGLAALGIDAAAVEHVIITHFHYDHTGNHALFPRATFWVQAAEMRFYTGRHAQQAAFNRSIEVDDVVALVRLAYAGRIHFVEGDAEVLPGIHVHRVGGHTAGMQIVRVQTERGWAVLASDAAHYYRELEEQISYVGFHDLPGVFDAFAQVQKLADTPDLIVPGHDPLVLERLHTVAPGIVAL